MTGACIPSNATNITAASADKTKSTATTETKKDGNAVVTKKPTTPGGSTKVAASKTATPVKVSTPTTAKTSSKSGTHSSSKSLTKKSSSVKDSKASTSDGSF